MTARLPEQHPRAAAFTLLELLVVIAIIGLLAAVATPAIRNISKGQATSSASRQMLDDIARARQLAIAHRTTVYMVFVPPNFWSDYSYLGNQLAWNALITPPTGSTVELEKARPLLDRQAAAYTFITLRSIGDQPGRNTIQYLSTWRTLPEGAFIQTNKFIHPSATPSSYYINDPVNGSSFYVTPFPVKSVFPFPSEDSPVLAQSQSQTPFWLPYIAFNHLGQLESNQDEYIPIARGGVSYARDANKVPQFSASPSGVNESPPGNSTNAYTLVHIDRITGRARIEQPQVK